jgi:glycine betaine/proline transport system permease protein
LQLSTGTFWSEVVTWININFFDTLESIKNAMLLNVLIPFKRFLGGSALVRRDALLALPDTGSAAGAGAADHWLPTVHRHHRSVGKGDDHGLSVRHLRCARGIDRAAHRGLFAPPVTGSGRWVQVAIDTLQTLPSFVYLMPAVMLFRVGDFTAMIAVVAFAIAPAIRYTALGIRKVDPKLIEAGRAMGCTEWQILTRIRLKLALPEILLGLNQTIMFALSMLVITALVGTSDLGQEVYIALTKADTGRGLVAGLSIAAIAIIADRLISAGASHARRRLGLE